MKGKVTIIGAGAVGATTAFALLACDITSEIVLIDVNKEKAIGEALDLSQATPLLSNCHIIDGDYSDAEGSDFVVITSGVGRKPGQTRLELAQVNTNIIKSVAPEIVRYAPKATYIIVANPVDILTYAFMKYTGLPRNQVFGTGTMLDTIRLRTMVANCYGISKKQVHASVFGEHGDSSFVTWSSATIGGIPLKEYEQSLIDNNLPFTPYTREEVEEYVKKSGGEIIKRKGCTVYGIASSVMHVIKCLEGSYDHLLSVSTLMEGEYGINDICLSTHSLVGRNGVKAIIHERLDEDEMEKLFYSAKSLKEVKDSIVF